MIVVGTDGTDPKVSGLCWIPTRKKRFGRGGFVKKVNISSKLTTLPIKKIVYDNRLAIFIDSGGKLIICSSNNRDIGPLGFKDTICTPGEMKLLSMIPFADAAIGDAHILFIGDDRTLYQVGNTEDGMLGMVTEIPGFRSVTCGAVRSVSAFGNTFGICLMNGNVKMWGCNTDGQISPVVGDFVEEPYELEINKQIYDIAIGCSHTLLLGVDDKCYTVGYYDDCDYVERTLCPDEAEKAIEEERVVARYVKLHTDELITQISSGIDHSGGINKLGEVIMWGSNTHGQLGFSHIDKVNKPNKLEIPGGAFSISCHGNYSVVVSNSGSVYAYGDNDGYNIGVEGDSVITYPTKVSKVKMAK